jgi:hypothetical protein
MTDEYKFARTYWHLGCRRVDFGPDLRDLVAEGVREEDRGDCSNIGYFEFVDGAWAPATEARAITEEIQTAQYAEWDLDAANAREQRWQVHLTGPDGIIQFFSRHPSRQAAEDAVALIPAHVHPTVKEAR